MNINLLVIQLRATAKHIRECKEYANLCVDADYIDRAANELEQGVSVVEKACEVLAEKDHPLSLTQVSILSEHFGEE